MYENIRSDCGAVIEHLREIANAFASCQGTTVRRRPETLAEATTSRESYYYWTRSIYNKMTPEERRSPKGSATLIFLNKTCFRGIYREGPGGFNVPFGHYKNPAIYDPDHLLVVSDLIRGVVFRHASFADSLADVRPGSFVYMDPPYAPASATSFVGYTDAGFAEKDHKNLFELCDALSTNGISLVMSNADVPLVRTNFPTDRYMTTVVSCRRAINAKNPASRANEVIVASI